jgi:hypothetical protein
MKEGQGARREVVRHVKFWLPSVVVLVVGGSIAEAYGRWFLSLILTVGAFLAVVVSLSPNGSESSVQHKEQSQPTETLRGESNSEG